MRCVVHVAVRSRSLHRLGVRAGSSDEMAMLGRDVSNVNVQLSVNSVQTHVEATAEQLSERGQEPAPEIRRCQRASAIADSRCGAAPLSLRRAAGPRSRPQCELEVGDNEVWGGGGGSGFRAGAHAVPCRPWRQN